MNRKDVSLYLAAAGGAIGIFAVALPDTTPGSARAIALAASQAIFAAALVLRGGGDHSHPEAGPPPEPLP